VLLSEETRRSAGLDEEVSLQDLGEHRLKDFAQAVRIFQLGAERFPPLKTISNTNLPRPASSFVGREREVAEVVALLRRDGARLVTLIGPGGSGKTRLSIEAAAELVGDHMAGTFWVELAPLRDSTLVTGEIAKTLGASDGLADHIGVREMLLVLDNLEQVIDAAPELASLVEVCPNLRILVTSRERLRVRGEVEYPVRPLAEPDAVQLFLARSGLDQADDAVYELCRALDNLPLAIELAAARTSALSPVQILGRLSRRLDLLKGGRDADPRQRTLRSAIEWSHDLLGDAEQRLFARLAVFVGGCTLETAEQVAGAELDTLQSLVDKSLLRHTDDRFRMLETIREFALERLEASGEADDIRQRHSEHFLELSEEAEPHLIREYHYRVGPWIVRVESEFDNLRAALDVFEAAGNGDGVIRMAGALSWVWDQRQPAEGRRRLEWALTADRRPTAARARALTGLAALAVLMGDLATAKARAEEGLALHRQLGDPGRIADAVHILGRVTAEGGDMLGARTLFEESIRLARQAGDENYAMWATRSFAWTYHALEDLERARALHEENLRRAREMGNRPVEATTLGSLGTIAIDEGRASDALLVLEQAYRLHAHLGERLDAAIDLVRFSAALADIGLAEQAVELNSLSDSLREELGTRMPTVERMAEKALARPQEQLEPIEFDEAWERGRRLTPDDAVAMALAASRDASP
jgi:predicted ATPase